MYKLTYILTSFFILSTFTAASPTSRPSNWLPWPACPVPTKIVLRFPPTIRNNTPPNWPVPPYAWIFGNWYVRYSSRLDYQSIYNFQSDTYPTFPTTEAEAQARKTIDLTSYQTAITGNASADAQIYTAFGYDTPLVDLAPSVNRFNGVAAIATVTNIWEVLAWGYDTNGIGWRAEYETAVPGGAEPCINILSRAENGPSNSTLADIHAALHELFDGSEVGPYTTNITELHIDGRRTGLGPVACDESCLANTNNPT